VRFSEVLSFEVDEWVCGAEERAGRREGGLRCCVLLYVCMYVCMYFFPLAKTNAPSGHSASYILRVSGFISADSIVRRVPNSPLGER
jgi:hypothetical protein